MKRALSVTFGAVLLVIGASAVAQSQPITVKPQDVKWVDMKGIPGWKQAVLAGDPEKPGPYVERIKIPPNAAVPPHSHPDTENITVLAGTFGSRRRPQSRQGCGAGARRRFFLPVARQRSAFRLGRSQGSDPPDPRHRAFRDDHGRAPQEIASGRRNGHKQNAAACRGVFSAQARCRYFCGTFDQVESGLNSVIAFAIAAPFGPRSFS